MNKRGQVTIFIIIAIILIAAGSLYFVFKDKKSSTEIPSEIEPIISFVQECIESEIEDIVYLVGEGGGYLFPPAKSSEGGFTYYFYEGEDYFPSKSEIEEQLTNSVESNVVFCAGDFEEFPNYDVEKREIKVDTRIFDDEVVFEVEFPLKISFEEEVYLLENFGEFEVPVRLGLIHKLIGDLIKDGSYTESSICLNCFAEIVLENSMVVNFLDAGEGNSIFIIEDYNEYTNKTFEYIFAV